MFSWGAWRHVSSILFALCVLICLAASDARAQGACCTFDSCLPAADDPECSGLNGVFFDGEDCANNPCAEGACCNGLSCAQAEAFPCITAGRTFAGAGTSCLDDPCGAGVGACCDNGACTFDSPEQCASAGGVWLGAGTNCTQGLCELGSCCAPGLCDELASYECNAAGGIFDPGSDCTTEPCAVDNDCATNSLYAQSPDGDQAFTAYKSEDAANLQRIVLRVKQGLPLYPRKPEFPPLGPAGR